MQFFLNMVTVWVLLFVFFIIVARVLLKVIWILSGKDTEPFDVRKFPAFLARFILPEFGGLLVISLFTFLQPTALPEAFAQYLLAIQDGIFVVIALGTVAKHVAEIKDLYSIKST